MQFSSLLGWFMFLYLRERERYIVTCWVSSDDVTWCNGFEEGYKLCRLARFWLIYISIRERLWHIECAATGDATWCSLKEGYTWCTLPRFWLIYVFIRDTQREIVTCRVCSDWWCNMVQLKRGSYMMYFTSLLVDLCFYTWHTERDCDMSSVQRLVMQHGAA